MQTHSWLASVLVFLVAVVIAAFIAPQFAVGSAFLEAAAAIVALRHLCRMRRGRPDWRVLLWPVGTLLVAVPTFLLSTGLCIYMLAARLR